MLVGLNEMKPNIPAFPRLAHQSFAHSGPPVTRYSSGLPTLGFISFSPTYRISGPFRNTPQTSKPFVLSLSKCVRLAGGGHGEAALRQAQDERGVGRADVGGYRSRYPRRHLIEHPMLGI